MNNELLVKSIRELCRNNNIAISQLENDLCFGAGLISRWTKSSPSLDKIIDIADYFHVSLDEIVGYKKDDVFLNMLCDMTDNKEIKWSVVDKSVAESVANPRRDPIIYGHYNDEKYGEKAYFTKYNDGIFIIYSFYERCNLLNPYELSLYIQPPSSKGEIDYAWQDYSTSVLKILWIKILSNMDDVPIEIKAEEFKNSFVNEFNKKKNNSGTRVIGTADAGRFILNAKKNK